MKIVAEYSFNYGKEIISDKYLELLNEVKTVIKQVDANTCRTKISQEKTMIGQSLYSPKGLNNLFKQEFSNLNWNSHKEKCEYSNQYYIDNSNHYAQTRGAFREMDFVKNRLGVEVQFGKYAFMVYNVCAKMTIFKNLNIIDVGIEIVPVKALAEQMSTGVSYFEQFTWDLDHRGVSNIDTPVLILGLDI